MSVTETKANSKRLKINWYELSGLIQVFWKETIVLYDEQI